ncbi:serine/threonine-protein kinase Nek2 [Halyomorpha halys]|uniref:serine/threonine-protein kinase Nek2 n=1 Tax=Halyomorpha halys TaxID=286706 RepID=UPI0034D317D7
MSQKLDDFDVISVVGTGSFGTCYKIRHKFSKEFYVWKAIDYGKLSEEKKKLLVSEVNLLSQLHHPNIVEYFDRIIRKETSTLYIIMEWCQGGDLSALIKTCRIENKKFDESFIWKALYQISKALQVCHTKLPQMTLLHRDIKPANIFIDSKGNFKLGDFGLAQSEDDCNTSDNIVGTPYYMSPEIIRGRKYDRKSDIWALGCLIYELCSLIPPFRGVTLQELVLNIKAGRYPPIPEFYSEHLHTIVTFMLTVKREFRPTVEMIIHHPLVVVHVTPELHTANKPSQMKYKERSEEKIQELKDLSKGISNISLSQRNPEDISEALFKERWINRLENLRERESKLREREELLSLKEESLNNKEKYLSLLEKRTKERMTQAQLYLNRKKGKLSNSIEDMSDISADPGDTSILPTSAKFNPSGLPKPCFLRLSSSRKTVASKHVHFERKPLKESGANVQHFAGDKFQKQYFMDPRIEEMMWLEQKRNNFQIRQFESTNKENVSTFKNKKTK